MPDPIDEIFKNAIQLPLEPLPLNQAEALQPSTVSGVGELKGGSGTPAQQRLHDKEIALLITEDSLMGVAEDSLLGATFAVRVRQAGGSAGSATTQCSFTYEVYSLAGEILADSVVTPMTPQHPRPSVGRMVAPSNDSYGIAFLEETEVLVLWDVGEVPAVEVCT